MKGLKMNAKRQLLLCCCIMLPLALACTTPRHPRPLPGEERILVLPGGAEMSMIYCPPGTFLMGSPEDEEGRSEDETLHMVTLSSGFWLGKTEVTQAQWCSVMGCNPLEEPRMADEIDSWPGLQNFGLISCNPSWTRGADYPVHNVPRLFCQEFVDRINKQLRGGKVMLPTEAQWEYACRAGSEGAFSGETEALCWHEEGDSATRSTVLGQPFRTIMHWGEAVPDDGWWHPHPVAMKKPNAWGFYDMHGNVAEWCRDGYGPYSGDCRDPMEKVSLWDEIGFGVYVLRGAFPDDPGQSDATSCRAAKRYGRPEDHREGPCAYLIDFENYYRLLLF